MTDDLVPTADRSAPRPRLWPPAAIVVVFWLVRQTAGALWPGTFVHFLTFFWGPIVAGVAVTVWILGFSRLPRRERFVSPAFLIAGGLAAFPLVDVSMRMALLLIAWPWVLTVAAAWWAATQRAGSRRRQVGLAVLATAVWACGALVRLEGLGGDLAPSFAWRWTPTAEERFLSERRVAPDAAGSTDSLVVGPNDWPEFRGPRRDGVVRGVRLDAATWSERPPRLIWKRRVGPGWSSFAVVGGFAFTQEQRGENEAVVCYRLLDGEPVWTREMPGRFWEVVAGAGPRATPTFAAGRLYAFTADGVLVCLDAADGQLRWRRDVKADTAAALPQWGFASSPLVVAGRIIVIAGGPEERSVAAYGATDGAIAWFGGRGTYSYASPQPAVIDGVEQILSATDQGLDALDPATGATLWSYAWTVHEGAARIVQPYVTRDEEIVLATGYGAGTRRLRPRRRDGAWHVEEVWSTRRFNPYFNDFVVVDEYAYGFDGNIFCCVDLKTGDRRWKAGRFGYGQVLSVEDGRRLLVLGDEGQAVLSAADPDELRELGRFQALDGKTWNHPVIVGRRLLVRNAEESACYELAD